MSRYDSGEFKKGLNTQRFELVRSLGQGGMGIVYEARDLELNARVALKTLKSLDPDGLLRFKNEFREFQNVSHPNLVSLGELFSQSGDWFFSMELVEGTTFLDWVRPYGHSLRADEPTGRITPSPSDTVKSAPTNTSEVHDPITIIPDGKIGGTLNPQRLVESVRQLALGLMAIHDAGKVHRDVKPSNTLVTPTGRVVVLDFGLSSKRDYAKEGPDADIVGTVAYMSPEQAAGGYVTPAADWYAVGVMMFQAITGTLPFDGDVMRILLDKQTQTAPRCSSREPSVDPELDETVAQLLRFNPGKRLDGNGLLRRIGAQKSNAQASFSLDTVFIGREQQLQELHAAYQSVPTKGFHAICLTGESGLGKTALVKYFTHQLEVNSNVVFLEGACYERESLPFKAVDGALDSLSRALARMKKEEVLPLLPRQAAMLSHFFPVLARAEAIAEAPLITEMPKDPIEQRNRLFAALRELFQRLSDRRRVILFIDDIQWSDADSWLLLSDVFRSPDAPNLLLVSTLRTSAEDTVEKWSKKLNEVFNNNVTYIPIARMALEDSQHLARTLLTKLGKDPNDAEAITKESEGHPLFIDALVRRDERVIAGQALSLDDTLWEQTTKLDPRARRILELISVSPGPVVQETILKASEVDPSQFPKMIGALRVSHFVRTLGLRASDTMVPYHDRIRQSVRKRLGEEHVRMLHRRIGVSMEMLGAKDPEGLVHHWREAGDHDRAVKYSELAAERAAQTLAFDRVVEHLRYALNHSFPHPEKATQLQIKLGEALANSGRGKEASDSYLQAAQHSDTKMSLELKRRAGDQLMRSGYLDEGVAVLQSVLAAARLGFASSPARALVNIVGRRSFLKLRGYGFSEKRENELSEDQKVRIDASWAASVGLSNVDAIRAADLQTVNLLLALRAGEPTRLGRALGMEAALVSLSGPTSYPNADSLLTKAEALANKTQDSSSIAFTRLIRGVINFQASRWADACKWFDESLHLMKLERTVQAWESGTAELACLIALAYRGNLLEMTRRVHQQSKDALARGDRFSTTHMRLSHLNLAWLLTDTPDVATQQIRLAMEEWSPKLYTIQHYYALVAQTQVDLYTGNYQSGFDRLTKEWKNLQRSMILRVQVIHVEALFLKARCLLGLNDPSATQKLRKVSRALAGMGTPPAIAFSHYIESVLAHRDHHEDAARKKLDSASQAFANAEMAAHAALCRHVLANKPESDFQWEAVTNGPAFSRMLLPGLSDFHA